MSGDEARDRPRGRIHDGDRDQHRRDHDADVLRHADRRDNGIDREDHVDEDDLANHQRHRAARRKRAGRTARTVRPLQLTLDLGMQLMGRLGDEEQAAEDENEVVPGKLIIPQGEDNGGKPEQRGECKQERNPEDGREREAKAARGFATPGIKARHQDRDEDDIVDPEHDFERSQAHQRRPRVETGQKLPHRLHPKDRSPAICQILNAWTMRSSARPNAAGIIAKRFADHGRAVTTRIKL